jgi:ATP-dependent RNA helicase SUPV3L1/SUV3
MGGASQYAKQNNVRTLSTHTYNCSLLTFQLPPLSMRPRGPPTNFQFGDRRRINMKQLRSVVISRLEHLEPELLKSPVVEQPGRTPDDAAEAIVKFRDHVWEALGPVPVAKERTQDLSVILLQAYIDRGEKGLDSQLKYAFYGYLFGGSFSATDVKNQKALADLRYPVEWFPITRQRQRTVHVHIGPTNSGKTYHALKRLEEATEGAYAGPLRLLAHEVYSRLNAKGMSCCLVTGEEQRMPDGFRESERRAVSCTVEMLPLHKDLDVAVIDEIQMLGSKERGWAWTNALVGVRAKEVHVCGEERALPLVQQLCIAMGDKIEVHRYKRLTPLAVEGSSLGGDFRKLRKGDCVVTFSVMAIHSLRAEIEKLTKKRVAVVYGSLPPETRAQQARLFNDPNNDYDYLVASDAIGMGLNL